MTQTATTVFTGDIASWRIKKVTKDVVHRLWLDIFDLHLSGTNSVSFRNPQWTQKVSLTLSFRTSRTYGGPSIINIDVARELI